MLGPLVYGAGYPLVWTRTSAIVHIMERPLLAESGRAALSLHRGCSRRRSAIFSDRQTTRCNAAVGTCRQAGARYPIECLVNGAAVL